MLGWFAVLSVIAVPVAAVVWFLRRPVDRTDVELRETDPEGDPEDVTRDVLLRSGDDSVQDAAGVLGHSVPMRRPPGRI